GTAVDARFRDHRFGTHEHRRDHDLIADDEAIDDQVVTIDLPSPGLLLRWLTEQTDEVDPLAVLGPTAGDFSNSVVEPHDVARRAKAAGAQSMLEQPQRSVTLLVLEVLQQQPVAHQERV